MILFPCVVFALLGLVELLIRGVVILLLALTVIGLILIAFGISDGHGELLVKPVCFTMAQKCLEVYHDQVKRTPIYDPH